MTESNRRSSPEIRGRLGLKFIFYRRFWERSNWRFGRWPMSSGTAIDLGPVRVMTRRAFLGANRISDWWHE